MKILDHVKDLRKVVLENFQTLGKPYHQNQIGFVVTSIELAERDIRGGLDTWDENRQIVITQDGWDIFEYQEETNMHAYAGSKITQYKHNKVNDEFIAKYLNGNVCTINEVLQFVDTYNNVAKDYGGLEHINS